MTELEVGRYALRTFALHYDYERDRALLGPLAHSVGNDNCWRDGICTAQCLRAAYGISRRDARSGAFLPAPSGHTAPHRACSCGIYGSLDIASLRDQYGNMTTNVTAIIAAEGVTIIGTKGLRTQYARVVAYQAGNRTYGRVAARQFKDAQEYEYLSEMLEAYNLPYFVGQPPSLLGHTYGHRYWR